MNPIVAGKKVKDFLVKPLFAELQRMDFYLQPLVASVTGLVADVQGMLADVQGKD
jgi:hypothetical protein